MESYSDGIGSGMRAMLSGMQARARSTLFLRPRSGTGARAS